MATVVLEIIKTSVQIVETADPVELLITESPVTLELTGGGLLLAAEIVAGLNAANAPSGENPFATITDLQSVFPMRVPVRSDWNNPSNCLADIEATIGWSFRPGGGDQRAMVSLTRLMIDQSSSALLLVTMVGAMKFASYKVPWQTGAPEITDPPEETLLTAITNFDPATAIQAAVGAHIGATDPHGDRSYADGLAVNYDAAGAASTAVANHASAVDPHGDRANTTSQIGAHAADSGAHRNYARIMMGV